MHAGQHLHIYFGMFLLLPKAINHQLTYKYTQARGWDEVSWQGCDLQLWKTMGEIFMASTSKKNHWVRGGLQKEKLLFSSILGFSVSLIYSRITNITTNENTLVET